MTKRIFKAIIIVALIMIFACIGLFMCVQYDYFTSLQQKQLAIEAEIISKEIKLNGTDYVSEYNFDNCEIYVVDRNGNCVYASESKAHLEDLSDCLDEESGIVSNSIFENVVFYSKSIDSDNVLIIITLQSTVLKLLIEMTYPIILILLFSILLSIILAYRVSKSIVRPLNEMDLDEPLSSRDYDELAPMLNKLDSQKNKLKKQEIELKYKRDEFEIVTENLSEGLILININGDILSINKAAADIFKINPESRKNIADINVNSELYDLIRNSYDGKKAEAVLDLNTGKYQVDINPVFSDELVAGVVVLIFDVTEKENSEKMRREFSANVSHELKTPLQSISGYAELLQHNLVKSEDISSFGGKIYSEAHRMIHLVDDIIHLSRLDEGAAEMPYSEVNLLKVAQDVADNLKPEAENMDVTVTVGGDNVEITAIPHLVTGIIFNLCDNAIKYNKLHGKVDITVKREDNTAKVIVSDTGIGIPKEDFSRIFERFYRVDKSHSKEVGGTGLGLSIVKHAAIIHDAKIDLESTLNSGTTITVSFPT